MKCHQTIKSGGKSLRNLLKIACCDELLNEVGP